MFFCALSGEPPQEPVVSAKSGHVYEKRLVIKYINENGTDPISGDKLTEDELIPVRASPNTAPPRPPSHNSIPSLLHALQNEWDALVLEQFSLRQQYNSIRQELAHALYQFDAATRVTARLMKERDAAREALASVQATMGVAPSSQGADAEMQEPEPSEPAGVLPDDVKAEVEETRQTLSSIRKKKTKPGPSYSTIRQISSFTSKHTITSLHSPSPAGVTALALSKQNPSQFISGGNDKIVQVYDKESNKVLATLKGHTKKVNHVAWREKEGSPSLVISGSADKTVRIWSHDAASGDYAPAHTVKVHKGEISGLWVHPTSTILGISSLDKTFSLQSLSIFKPIFQSAPQPDPYTAFSTHPDGVLLGLGTARSTVHIYDVRTGSVVLDMHSGELSASAHSVNTMAFSENGYHLAFPETPSSVSVWDLRKTKVVTSTNFEKEDAGVPYKINKVQYDLGAQYLGVAGSDVRVIANKTWAQLVQFDGGADVADFAWGANAREIWAASGREVRIWGLSD
ncbi:nuclear matrix protein NMP200 [Cantharellus anzutake]|uniref:nuclear matrix protein NMP200 n=1 Tax=Cantharellus anzutake TaxID=1750568 RepID=UPI001903B3B5|nr:nuclear matrix protein NMP200 [Cantharellus anzutake]KAF8342882.1 nuclear matrix protein NMP200 [Cantharellus anzutake]